MFKWKIACGNMVKKVFSLNLCGTQASMQLTCQAGAEGFQGLIWIFECVGYLLHDITLIILSECLGLIATNFNWST